MPVSTRAVPSMTSNTARTILTTSGSRFVRTSAPQLRECHLVRCRPQAEGSSTWPAPGSGAAEPTQPRDSAATAPPEKETLPKSTGFPTQLDADIFAMAVPSLAAVILDPLLGMVDTAIVGQLGGQVLAGTHSSIRAHRPFTLQQCCHRMGTNSRELQAWA